MKLSRLFSAAGGSGKHSDAKSTQTDPTQQAKVIIDSIEDGVILIDSSHVIRLINPAAGRICGWKIDEATGIGIESVIKFVTEKGEPLDSNENPINLIFKNGQSINGSDYFIINREQKQIPVRLHISPMLDKENSVYQVVAVLNNVSEEKSNERQRADFISTASHEMRTPVAAIEGYLALALNDKVATVDNRARDYLEKAHASTQHLGKLFQDLLTSAKAEDGRLTSHPQVVEIGDFLEQLSGDLRLVAEKKGLNMEFASGSDVVTINATKNRSAERVLRPLYYIYVDPDRLREVITNLFDNAVKYTEEGKVTIGLTGNDQVVQCYVKDTGPGIPSDDLPHLFQKFYRVDSSATRTVGGTGLGLFICRKIIELYSGRIWAESELGKGSTFYINLPRLTTQKVNELNAVGREGEEIKPTTI